MRLTSKQHQVLAAVAAGIVRPVNHRLSSSTKFNQRFTMHYYVGQENVTSAVRALRHRGLIKGDDKLELVT